MPPIHRSRARPSGILSLIHIFVVPELGESVVEATVGEWRVKVGDSVKAGDVIVELETDKVDIEVGATAAGVMADIRQPAGSDVRIGDVLGTIDGDGATATPTAQPPQATTTATAAAEPDAKPGDKAAEKEKATPVARRMAEAEGVDLAQVSGSGAGGRVTKQDVAARVEPEGTTATTPPADVPPAPAPTPTQPAPTASPLSAPSSAGRREERQRMSRRRRTIAQRLVEAQHTAAMLTTFNEIDMGAVMELRARRQDEFVKRYGVKIGRAHV